MSAGPFVFNIGFNKSGTTSLGHALNTLAVPTVDHRIKVQSSSGTRAVRLVDIIRQNLRKERRPFQGLDHRFRGFTDFMGESFYKTLDAAYPNSKFILTIRDLDAWLASREKHVMRNLRNPNYKGGFTKVNRGAWTQLYRTHIEETQRYFAPRPNSLLIMNIAAGDGWEKLCPFLGCELPSDPFPRLNQAEG